MLELAQYLYGSFVGLGAAVAYWSVGGGVHTSKWCLRSGLLGGVLGDEGV